MGPKFEDAIFILKAITLLFDRLHLALTHLHVEQSVLKNSSTTKT